MAQYERPDADISTGSWGASPLWSKLDEVSYSDADYISCSVSTTCEIRLSDATDPISSSGHIIRVRAKASTGENSITVSLLQGANLIHSYDISSGITYSTNEHTLTATETNSISDYTDLRLRFDNTQISGISYISWVEFEIPDASGVPSASPSASPSVSPSVNISPSVSPSISPSISPKEGVWL